MALPDRKKPFLEEALGEEAVEELEQTLADGAKELEEAQIESKEEAAVEEPVVEEPQEEEAEESKEEEDAEAPQYVTHDELEQVFAGHVKPLVDQLRSALDEVASQQEEIKALEAQVKELQKDDEAKLKEALQNTPAASLFSRIGSVIGSDETAVDGRTSLAKAAPEEAKEPSNGPTFVPGLNEYIARQWGG